MRSVAALAIRSRRNVADHGRRLLAAQDPAKARKLHALLEAAEAGLERAAPRAAGGQSVFISPGRFRRTRLTMRATRVPQGLGELDGGAQDFAATPLEFFRSASY
jgi:hypothetical protein